MKGLTPEHVSDYLSLLQAIKSSCPLYDMHVHPYEVLFDRFSYEHGPARPGVLSLAGKSYADPSLSNFHFPEMGDFKDEPRSQRLQDISVMLLKKVYGHVGEQVFIDQMTLSGIDKVLLLPVASESCTPGQFADRMRWVKQFYSNEERFWIAGSIPSAVSAIELGPYVRSLKMAYGIKAIKCHPVVSGIDLSSRSRRDWLEGVLAACSDSKLPLVIHGGRNNLYWGGSRGNFASLEHLKEIDMSLSEESVILAHAGFHRCALPEIQAEGVPMLNQMLKAHRNLYVDISGLGFEPLKLVLGSVNIDRILFGSDALYSPQWEAVTMTLHALKELGMELEENFVQIAHINPKKTLFKDQLPC